MLIRRFGLVLLTALITLSLLAYWHSVNLIPSGHDGHVHYANSVRFAKAMDAGSEEFLALLSGQSAKYMPLHYISTAIFLKATGYSFWGYVIPMLLFWLIALIGLGVIGIQLSENRFAFLLPLAVFLAIPTSWEIGFSTNLETGVVAAAAVFLGLFVNPNRPSKIATTLAAALLMAILIQSKAVVLLPVALGGAVFLWALEKKNRWKKGLILAAAIGSALIWILPRFNTILSDISLDQNVAGQGILTALFYYLKLFLFGYRGIVLLVVLAIVIAFRAKQKDLGVYDLGFALFFLAPMVLFLSIDTYLHWYPLAGFLALPAWFLYSVNRQREMKWVRMCAVGTTLVYLLLAIANGVFVLLACGQPGKKYPVTQIRHPMPPADISRLDAMKKIKAGQKASIFGQGEALSEFMQMMVAANVHDHEARLNLATAMAEKGEGEKAANRFNELFSGNASFATQIEALKEIGQLEADGKMAPGKFGQYFKQLFEKNMGDKKLEYSLYSVLVHVESRKKNWEKALTAVEKLEGTLNPEQVPGVNLQKAGIYFELRKMDEAETLLWQNIKLVNEKNPILSESLLMLAKVHVEKDAFDNAIKIIERIIKGNFSKGTLVVGTIEISNRMQEKNVDQKAESLLLMVSPLIDGEQGALIFIELGKLAQKHGQIEKAITDFERALKMTGNPTTITWIQGVISDLNSKKTDSD